jgi:hypothetical protein
MAGRKPSHVQRTAPLFTPCRDTQRPTPLQVNPFSSTRGCQVCIVESYMYMSPQHTVQVDPTQRTVARHRTATALTALARLFALLATSSNPFMDAASCTSTCAPQRACLRAGQHALLADSMRLFRLLRVLGSLCCSARTLATSSVACHQGLQEALAAPDAMWLVAWRTTMLL